MGPKEGAPILHYSQWREKTAKTQGLMSNQRASAEETEGGVGGAFTERLPLVQCQLNKSMQGGVLSPA